MNWREGFRRLTVVLSVLSLIGWSIFWLCILGDALYYNDPIEVLGMGALSILATVAGLWVFYYLMRWMITYVIHGFRQHKQKGGAPTELKEDPGEEARMRREESAKEREVRWLLEERQGFTERRTTIPEEQNTVREKDQDATIEPKGIAGWLIIPAIGLVGAPIKSVGMLIVGITGVRGSELASDPRVWLTGFIDVVMIIATVVVAVLFFQKRRIAVPAFVGLMATSIVASAAQVFLNAAILQEVDAADIIRSVGRTCVFAAVWIPYFYKSKRVKNTFIN